MSTTPTPADHDAAKRLADRAGLTVPPWQLEHIAAALADARAEGHVEGRREALAAELRTPTDPAGKTARDIELGHIVVAMHAPRWPMQTAARIAQVRADARRDALAAARRDALAAGRREGLDAAADRLRLWASTLEGINPDGIGRHL